MRPRLILIGLAAAIIAVLVVLGVADSFVVDLVWFSSLGFRAVVFTWLFAQVGVFVAVFVVAAAALYLSGLIALRATPDRERLRVVRFPEDLRQLSLPEVIRSLGERVPWRLLIGAAVRHCWASLSRSAKRRTGTFTSRPSTGRSSVSPSRRLAGMRGFLFHAAAADRPALSRVAADLSGRRDRGGSLLGARRA